MIRLIEKLWIWIWVIKQSKCPKCFAKLGFYDDFGSAYFYCPNDSEAFDEYGRKLYGGEPDLDSYEENQAEYEQEKAEHTGERIEDR